MRARPPVRPPGLPPTRLAPAPDIDLPKLKIVSKYKAAAAPGMPGPYRGKVISVKSEKVVDVTSNQANAEIVKQMMAKGMSALTGDANPDDAWKRFFQKDDVVGIKVNCGGYPYCVSAYEIVGRDDRAAAEGRDSADADLHLRAVPESAG